VATQTLKTPFGGNVTVYGPGSAVPARPLSRTRWFIAADHKQGKTTFGASVVNGFVIDVERKMDLVQARHPTNGWAGVSSLAEFDTLVQWLIKEKKNLPYEMVVVDTIDELLHGILIPGLTEEYRTKLGDRWKVDDIREYGASDRGSRGWDIIYGRLMDIFRDLYAAGYGWIVLGHTREEEIRKIVNGVQMVHTKKRPAIPAGARVQIFRASEFIGTLHWKTSVVADPQVLVDGVWVPRTDELVARIKEKGGRLLERTAQSNVRQCVLSVVEKESDSEVRVGSNVSLPPEIVLPLGAGWQAILNVYTQQKGDSQ